MKPVPDDPFGDGRIVLVGCDGEIDIQNAPEFGEQLLEAAARAHQGVVVDLSAVTYIDSAGIHSLFAVASRLDAARARLALVVAATSRIRRLFEMTRLVDVVTVHETVADAVNDLRNGDSLAG